MEHRSIRGVELAIQRSGDRSGDGGGRAFVWAHGLTSSMEGDDVSGFFTWSIPGFEVIRYDAIGHGRSSGPAEEAAYRWDELAADLLGVMDAVGVERAVLGGASMGCATALHAAVAAADRVDALVLAIPPTAWATRRAQASAFLADAALVESGGPAALAARVRTEPVPAVFADLGRLYTDAAGAAFEAMDPATLPLVLRGAAASDLPEPEALSSVSVPTLVLAWAGDPGHPLSTAEALAGLLADADLRVAEDLATVFTWPAVVADFLGSLVP